ncbi:SDR family NAD(P)-dependent oxidoreductase [Streptomyces antimycoticus]|uniref:SDR family NAD(P)-dependent oxidoreductase n=1 Tax=Streptomyces antimycoticus TaxID=68175 RepID=UPI0036ACDEE0
MTGAATGIGAAITERLAGQGMRLVLVARDGARLEAAAKRLRAEHGTQVSTLALDLSHQGAPCQLAQWLADAGTEVDVLVNNAGASLMPRNSWSELGYPWEEPGLRPCFDSRSKSCADRAPDGHLPWSGALLRCSEEAELFR